ncbi:unnamed protein product [Vicia faba]|uniref:BED-type domain-containing protein n=1 Tax=Vicia faba TaxID=3906 RepID=A0AAV0YML8_VICFA|nr:unnamed protein product [Vicia faba]
MREEAGRHMKQGGYLKIGYGMGFGGKNEFRIRTKPRKHTEENRGKSLNQNKEKKRSNLGSGASEVVVGRSGLGVMRDTFVTVSSVSNLSILLLFSGFTTPSSTTVVIYDSQAPPCHHAGHHEPPTIKEPSDVGYCQPLVYVKYPDAWSCLAVVVMEHPVPYVEPTQAVETALPPLPPSRKKRLVNASGSRKTFTVWLDFNILPDEPEPIAACKHCHKRYRCDPKTHGTSNMLAHSKVCHKNPNLLQKDPTQRNLVSGEGGFLGSTSQRFNAQACRKAITSFVLLDEHSFRVVEDDKTWSSKSDNDHKSLINLPLMKK